jgi:hypothetical protein
MTKKEIEFSIFRNRLKEHFSRGKTEVTLVEVKQMCRGFTYSFRFFQEYLVQLGFEHHNYALTGDETELVTYAPRNYQVVADL